MKTLETTGKTVDEAIAKALRELNVPADEVKVKVLEEPSKGIFGLIGSKMARVRVTWEENPTKKVCGFLTSVFTTMGLKVEIEPVDRGETVYLNLKGSRLGVLIGRRGQTLDSLQYLANLVANKDAAEKIRYVLDAEDYRRRREETLQKLAYRLANKVNRSGEKIVLEPMTAQERRIIHHALQDHRYVYTYSEGEEPNRRIVISPKREQSNGFRKEEGFRKVAGRR